MYIIFCVIVCHVDKRKPEQKQSNKWNKWSFNSSERDKFIERIKIVLFWSLSYFDSFLSQIGQIWGVIVDPSIGIVFNQICQLLERFQCNEIVVFASSLIVLERQ